MAAVRNLFTIFDFPKSDWRRFQRTDFVRSGVETISTPRRTKFVRRDQWFYVIKRPIFNCFPALYRFHKSQYHNIKIKLHHKESRNKIESAQSYGVSSENAHLKQNLLVILSQKLEKKALIWYTTDRRH